MARSLKSVFTEDLSTIFYYINITIFLFIFLINTTELHNSAYHYNDHPADSQNCNIELCHKV